jgi:hypothetical protein
MTANEEIRYQTLLHVAAETLRRRATAAANITYTASVTAVLTTTPTARRGAMCLKCSNIATLVLSAANVRRCAVIYNRFATSFASWIASA